MPRPLLGFDTEVPGLPCTVSVPNLKTDRIAGVALAAAALNVRRLMYQSLIWCMELRDEARRLRTSLDPEDVQRAADPLIDRMRGNPEFHRNLFRRKMLVDEQQRVELALAELGDKRGGR